MQEETLEAYAFIVDNKYQNLLEGAIDSSLVIYNLLNFLDAVIEKLTPDLTFSKEDYQKKIKDEYYLKLKS